MMTQGPEESGSSEQACVDSTPNAVLAQKVIADLVAEGLLSEIDGVSIRADLADGKVDSTRWKMVLENQIEREARADERK